jgi:amino acid adenylation domain-containing protein
MDPVEEAMAEVRVPVPRAQQRMWLADQLAGHGAVYLGSTNLRLRGPLDVAAVRRALTGIVTRHEVLRTSIAEIDGEMVGLLRPPDDFRLEVTDVDPARLDGELRTEAATPLDIAAGLPVRARLLRLAPDDHALCLSVHHAAYDGGSTRILYQEVAAGYAGESVPPPPRQFRDIAGEHDVREDAGALAAVVAERRAALAGRSPFELPTDHPRPPVRRGEGAHCHGFVVPPEVVRRLATLGDDRHATLYMVLLAGVHTVLYRYTGRADVTTGTSSSTRQDRDSALAIGPFINMVTIPGEVSGNPTFAELVSRVRERALDAYDAGTVALDTLVAALKVLRDPAVTPLFQILVDLALPAEPPALPGLEVTPMPPPGAGSKYDLTIEFGRRADGGVGITMEWDTALYDGETVRRLVGHLRAVLSAVAQDPSLRVEDVPMLSQDGVERLLATAVAEPAALPAATLHGGFLAQVARTPDAVAVRDERSTLTYAELDCRSAAIARGLATAGVGPDVPVGVLLDRSADLVAAVLGILRAGGAYLPIDPEAPLARVGTLLTGARAPVCLLPAEADPTEVDVPAARVAAARAGCHAVDIASLLRADPRTGELPQVGPDHLCAIYFTSGSTGVPKGVASTHRGWVSQMDNMQRCYRLEPDETVLLKTPLGFDDVAREIFWPLMRGGRIAVLPPGLHRDPRALVAAAAAYEVVWLQFVPSMLALFLEEVGPEQVRALARLRHVTSDGDRLPPETVRAFYAGLGADGCRLHNHWGTTEASIDSTHYLAGPADGEGGDAVALGRPMAHNEVYLLDGAQQPVPPGAVAELCIGGAGLARGYLHDPGRTARAFVPHPWRPGERLYRTGDTARLRADGVLEYRGRRDHQVKVRGVRIELGEVEAAVRAHPDVTDAVVATWEPTPGDHRLVAYATMAGDEASARGRLRDFLTDRLAPATVPNAIVLLPALPRNPSGKVDRRSLPEPALDTLHDQPFVAPATGTERALADIWAAVLHLDRLGANDDFFAAGGHSLLVTRVVNRVRDAFGVDVSIRLVFDHPTVRAAAAQLEELVIAEIEAMTDADAARLAADEIREEAHV